MRIEAEWLKTLLAHPKVGGLRRPPAAALDRAVKSFSVADAAAVKRIERRINHDVKAAERWLCARLAGTRLAKRVALVHFGCTSADINNLAVSLMSRRALRDWLLPELAAARRLLTRSAKKWAAAPMLAHTHGQPATPTTLGKELAVFAVRLKKAEAALAAIRLEGKMNGAVGNYNAHVVAYPDVDWPRLAAAFVCRLGLAHNTHTTQVEPYDSLAAAFDCLARANTVLVDLCRDMWAYISLDYLRQRPNAAEVGSSAMPHKVNPIDFENAEGNFGISTSQLRHLSGTLPVSRLQRDLTDSTVSRNIGVAFGHSLLGIKSLLRGLGKVAANRGKMRADLEGNAQVLAEAAASVMRVHGRADAYEMLRRLTRGKGAVGPQEMRGILAALPLPPREKRRLLALRPADYLGLAEELARL